MDGLRDWVLPVGDGSNKFQDRLTGLEHCIPSSLIEQVVRQSGCASKRKCRLNAQFTLWLVLAMGLFTDCPLRTVYRHCRRGRPHERIPSRGALCKARQRIGTKPLLLLFEMVVVLLCRPDVPGGFYAGLRLMGIDGVSFTAPATDANIRAFGLPKGGHTSASTGGYPLVSKVSLVELGSHVEYGFALRSQKQGEPTIARRLMNRVVPGMLVLLDAGFFGYPLLRSLQSTGAEFLVNVSQTPLLKPFQILPDGSSLSKIYASTSDRERDRNGRVVRVIQYQLDDPQRPGHGKTRRLVTTLLDSQTHSAETLIVLYHERWEHELLNDEQKTHQDPRRPQKPTHLRSETPSGLVQELLGLSLAHYEVRKSMFDAAVLSGVDPDRISFAGAFQILKARLPECPPRATPAEINTWYENLLIEIAEEKVPPRRNRINPRVIKRGRCKWPSKKAIHYQPAKLLKTFRESILII
jgi:hypothetical protein